MTSSFLRIVLLVALTALTACEVPAASGTVEVTLTNVSRQDINPYAGLIYAVASVNSGACVDGPCSPNPCLGDPQGKTACVGQGDVHQCRCPAGMHEFAEEEGATPICVPNTQCSDGNSCNGHGECSEEDGAISCECEPGYIGANCRECDGSAGSFPDGLGGCTSEPQTCRDGAGEEAFRKILADAEAELGLPPTELELSSARMEISGTPQGVRSWSYLFDDEVTLFVQTVSGFPSNAAQLDVPSAEAGLAPLEFDMNITRATTSADPQFFSGDFRVGLSAPTTRQLTEMFGADIKLLLDFSAY